MSTLTLMDNEYARLVYHPDQKIVHHQLKAKLDSIHLRRVLNGGIDLLRQYQATKWLSDNRAISAQSPEDGLWVNIDWLPRALAAGWKYWALVVPYDVTARTNMATFVQAFYDRGVRIMLFTDVDDALYWLEKVDQ